MKFRERYANQTASIRRLGVAAAALSRSANLRRRAGLGRASSLRGPPAMLAVDSEEAIAARNLQVQQKHDVQPKERGVKRKR